MIDFPFGGSAEDAIRDWLTLSTAANIKIREMFFMICFVLSDFEDHWARTITRPVM